jgi:hypothetical protein
MAGKNTFAEIPFCTDKKIVSLSFRPGDQWPWVLREPTSVPAPVPKDPGNPDHPTSVR